MILTALFIGYVYIIAKAPTEEPELIGPARTVGTLPKVQRRTAITIMLVYAAVAIIAAG